MRSKLMKLGAVFLFLVLVFVGYTIWRQGVTSRLVSALSENGILTIGIVNEHYETMQNHVSSYEVSYEVDGIVFTRKTNRGDRGLKIGNYVWILYDQKSPKKSLEYYFIAERLDGLASEFDTTGIDNTMKSTIASYNLFDVYKSVTYDSIGILVEGPLVEGFVDNMRGTEPSSPRLY